MTSLKDFADDKKQNKGALASEPTDALRSELAQREATENIFPLEIFHPMMRPLINAVVENYDIDRGFIGLGLLTSFSTAIGTSFCVSTNGKKPIYLSVWGCMVGMTSSGKSLNLDLTFSPHFVQQTLYDIEWQEKTEGMSEGQIRESHMPTVLFMDAYIPTLVRWILPDNPKGVCKIQDELLEWINGMNPNAKNGKEGTDEQFWLKVWNCAAAYIMRSGKQKTTLPRPFVNVFGGTQFEMLPQFFSKNRDVTGFIFRLLFAIDPRHTIVSPNPFFTMPREFEKPYEDMIKLLHDKFEVTNANDAPNMCILGKDTAQVYHNWVTQNVKRINRIDDNREKNIQAGIFGKIKEYALRFTAILYITDKCFNALAKSDTPDYFEIGLTPENHVPVDYMHRALMACEYFYKSAGTAYKIAKEHEQAPAEWLTFAALFNRGYSFTKIGCTMWGDPKDDADRKRKAKRAERMFKKYAPIYPWPIKSKK